MFKSYWNAAERIKHLEQENKRLQGVIEVNKRRAEDDIHRAQQITREVKSRELFECRTDRRDLIQRNEQLQSAARAAEKQLQGARDSLQRLLAVETMNTALLQDVARLEHLLRRYVERDTESVTHAGPG